MLKVRSCEDLRITKDSRRSLERDTVLEHVGSGLDLIPLELELSLIQSSDPERFYY